jgi:hypothetical protein
MDAMDTHGRSGRLWTQWTLMETRGHSWTFMDAMDTHGRSGRLWTQWTLMETHGHSWTFMDAMGAIGDDGRHGRSCSLLSLGMRGSRKLLRSGTSWVNNMCLSGNRSQGHIRPYGPERQETAVASCFYQRGKMYNATIQQPLHTGDRTHLGAREKMILAKLQHM